MFFPSFIFVFLRCICFPLPFAPALLHSVTGHFQAGRSHLPASKDNHNYEDESFDFYVGRTRVDWLDLCIDRQVHVDSIKNGIDFVVYVGNTLMHLYRLCGEVNDAQTMLEQMPRRTVVSWNTLLVFYTGRLMMGEAMKLFGQMRDNGCEFYLTTNIILPSILAVVLPVADLALYPLLRVCSSICCVSLQAVDGLALLSARRFCSKSLLALSLGIGGLSY
ncbi:putative pentatricopeptide repeat-containing protein [Platanthera guangdongensis]|uniref:Pentatricopeptide repeat-containing protein n=1 Tax=Platanthera guangdongensis TaxID=2320717 RepID=A0ABR2MPU6_9ASPA